MPVNPGSRVRTWSWITWSALMAATTIEILAVCLQHYTPGAHANLFAATTFLFPLVCILIPVDLLRHRVARAVLSVVIFVVVYRVFVGYMDRPWFAVEDRVRDDGPSFGWYTFEFDPPYGALVVLGLLGIAFGLLSIHIFRSIRPHPGAVH